jgi:prepilin-type N-terminal cleavage/methylation domain-containing protein
MLKDRVAVSCKKIMLLVLKPKLQVLLKAYDLKLKAGFTLVELLVGITLMLILASVATPIYGNMQVSAQINDNTAQIIQTIRIARARSIARQNGAAHGVYFEINAGDHDRYILYQGASYALRTAELDRSTELDDALSLATTLTGSEVNFSRGFGVPDNSGTVTLTHDVQDVRTIDINGAGKIEEN